VNLEHLRRNNSKAEDVTAITRLKTVYCRPVYLSEWGLELFGM
jgi:hypothetical protein